MPHEPTIDDLPEDPKALAVQTEISVVTNAIEASLGVKEITVEFAKRRDILTATALAFKTPPTNDAEQEKILVAQRAVAKLRIELTKNADALKTPLNAARGRIIEIEKTEVATLTKAEEHCQGLIAFRQKKLAEEREERERKAAAEAKRIADEAAAAQRAAEDAERKRKAAEAAALEAEAAKGRAKAKAEAEAKRLADEAKAAEAAAQAAQLQAEAAPEPVAVQPVSDMTMARKVHDYTVNGANEYEQHDSLVKFAAAYPNLVKIEIRRRDLLDLLNAGKITSAPGITITEKFTNLR